MMEDTEQIQLIDFLFNKIIRSEDSFAKRDKKTIMYANQIIHAKYKLDLARYGIENLPYPLEAYEPIPLPEKRITMPKRIPKYVRNAFEEMNNYPNFDHPYSPYNDPFYRKLQSRRVLVNDIDYADPDIPFEHSMDYYGDFVLEDDETKEQVWKRLLKELGRKHKRKTRKRTSSKTEAKKYKKKYMTLAKKAKKLLSNTFSL